MDFIDKCFYIRVAIFLLNVPVIYYILSVISSFLYKGSDSVIYSNDSKIVRSLSWIGSCIILVLAQILLFFVIENNMYYVIINENTKNIIDFVIMLLILAMFLPLNFIICNCGNIFDWTTYKKYKMNKWIISYSVNSLYLLTLLVSTFTTE